MKKLLIVINLAGILAVPSIVFAEATWYGSFRGGVESAGGSAHMQSFYSRWGVQGSNEVAEGLVANYRYEEDLDLATATLADGNRLSYVGLSGGFGTLSIGRIWSASFNSVGALLDPTVVYGDARTSYRIRNAVSYSNSAGAATVQVVLVMDGGNYYSKSGVDQYEFGLSFDLGAATLAFAHGRQYLAATTPAMAGTPTLLATKFNYADLAGPMPAANGGDPKCAEGTMLLDDKCFPDGMTKLTNTMHDGNPAMPLGPMDVSSSVDISTKMGCASPRVWEPVTGACYRSGTTFKYLTTPPPGTVFTVYIDHDTVYIDHDGDGDDMFEAPDEPTPLVPITITQGSATPSAMARNLPSMRL